MKKAIRIALLVVGFVSLLILPAQAADHGEPPLLQGLPASNIGDLYAFRNPNDQSQLVVVITFDPFVPPGTTVVPFDEDVKYVIHIDNAPTGDPEDIKDEIEVEVRFEEGEIEVKGDVEPTAVFAGVRDDPFIGNAAGFGDDLNINALVVQLPLDELVEDNAPLLIWAHTKTKGLRRKFQDFAGKPFTGFAFSDPLDPSISNEFNQLEPADQVDEFEDPMGLLPDVLTVNPEPDGLPNGRGLDDARAGMPPAPNDVPFLAVFPFLAEPN